MARIKIDGTLIMSAELFSRLCSRQLLSATGECTEEFLAYLQECIARDDARAQSPSISMPVTVTQQKSEVPKVTAPVSTSAQKHTPTITSDVIKQKLGTLYNSTS